MKNLIIIVLSCCTLLVSVYAIKLHYDKQQDHSRYKELLITSGKNEIVTEYVRDSINHTVFVDKIIKDNDLEKRMAITSQYADSLEMALKVSLSKVTQVTKLNAKLNATLQLHKQQDGTITYQDKYLSLLYKPTEELLDLSYKVNLNIARYSDRSWLLGQKKEYVNVYSDDPRVTIQGLNSFTLQPKPIRRFGIGLSSGYALTIENNKLVAQPYIGAGINYNLINF